VFAMLVPQIIKAEWSMPDTAQDTRTAKRRPIRRPANPVNHRGQDSALALRAEEG
jgi:hypothetical protein